MKTIILFLVFLPLAGSAWALESMRDQPNPKEFFEAGIHELLQMEVTTASRKKEALEKAPAVMSVITAEEIKKFGANNLLEILDRSPSVTTLGSYMYVDNVVSMRGDRITHMDNHVLILINGRPARENIFGGLNNSIYKTFPVGRISRIEIVRGPGSVLYGTNAYAGVINIITKEYKKNEGEVSFEYGSFDAKKVEVSGAGKIKDLELSAGLNYFRNNGWPFRAVDESGLAGATSFDEDNLGMTLLGEYKGIKLTGFFGNTTHQHWGSRPVWPSQSYDSHRGFADLEYERRIFDKWTAKLNLTYNYFWKEQNIGGTPETVSSTGILLEEMNFFALTDRVDLLVGGLVEGQSGLSTWEGHPDNIPNYDNTLLSGYFQFSYRPLDDVNLIAGGQLNKLSEQTLAFVPRFGLTYQITRHIGAKLLYGEAYRSPTEGEMSIIVPNVLRGNKNLKPEAIDTFDGQLFYSSDDVKASVTYFNSLQKDLISRVSVPGAAEPSYGNQGSIRSQGIELEGAWKVSRQLDLQGSYAYQTNWHNSGVNDWTHMPNHMAKAGVIYSVWPELSLGLFNSFFSKPSSVAEVNPKTAIVNPEPDFYNYLTSNVIYDLSRIMGVSPSLRFYAVNLLDEEIYYPEFNRRAINSIPGRPGRTFYGEISVKFK